MLTPEQLTAREGKFSASLAPKLCNGTPAEVLDLWRECVGDPAYVPDDLSDIWPVQYGSWVESFAIAWHERRTGRLLTRRGEVVVHPDMPWCCCTLDCFRDDDSSVIDVKAPGQWTKLDDVLVRYMPQMVVQRGCTGASRAALLVVHGGGEPVEYELIIPDDYADAVWARIRWFWSCVQTLTPPHDIAPLSAPVPPEKWRTIDLDKPDGELPNWAGEMTVELVRWAKTATAAKDNESAAKAAKKLLPDDVGKLLGADVAMTRSKNGAIAIKARKE